MPVDRKQNNLFLSTKVANVARRRSKALLGKKILTCSVAPRISRPKKNWTPDGKMPFLYGMKETELRKTVTAI